MTTYSISENEKQLQIMIEAMRKEMSQLRDNNRALTDLASELRAENKKLKTLTHYQQMVAESSK